MNLISTLDILLAAKNNGVKDVIIPVDELRRLSENFEESKKDFNKYKETIVKKLNKLFDDAKKSGKIIIAEECRYLPWMDIKAERYTYNLSDIQPVLNKEVEKALSKLKLEHQEVLGKIKNRGVIDRILNKGFENENL